MKVMLEWIEKFGDEEITTDRIKALEHDTEVCINIDPVEASSQVWSYLNLNIGESSVIEVFRNVELLNGFEAWRRIVMPVLSKPSPMRSRLRNKAWNPRPASKLSEFAGCLEAWAPEDSAAH